jgi:hypothetical protein
MNCRQNISSCLYAAGEFRVYSVEKVHKMLCDRIDGFATTSLSATKSGSSLAWMKFLLRP